MDYHTILKAGENIEVQIKNLKEVLELGRMELSRTPEHLRESDDYKKLVKNLGHLDEFTASIGFDLYVLIEHFKS